MLRLLCVVLTIAMLVACQPLSASVLKVWHSDCVTIQFFRIFLKNPSTLGLKLGLNREKTPIICLFLLFSLHFDYRTRLLFSIVVPLSIPVLSVLFVFFFIWTWNAFFLPLIFLISSAKYTVPLAVALTEGEYNTVITTQSAGALLGILPCILFFVIFQRTLTKGITLGSIK